MMVVSCTVTSSGYGVFIKKLHAIALIFVALGLDKHVILVVDT
jgi:hypothetical protein